MSTPGPSFVARTVAFALLIASFGASAAEPAPPQHAPHAQHAAPAATAPPAGTQAPTPEMRASMAAAHERMAACLRSDKPMADCHAAMQAHCRSMIGGQGCPMMGMGGQDCAMMGPGKMGP